MSCFDGVDLNRLFDINSSNRSSSLSNDVTDELISRAEETMGYKLPESYKELLRFRNGGSINGDLEECWLTEIYGIAADPD
ncbi:MAG: SMI1/KNR4 family protein, partial [Mogibacterium sp.]|nr:SMI1/KNR4 family protein [Mogibacterium sp.]